MTKIRTTLALAASAGAAFLAMASFLPPARATQDKISLMQTISEWKYPGSTQLGGASMSDGGNPEIPDLTCLASFTTPDPVADVVKFYEEKAGKAPESRAVVTQDDSKGRPVAVRIIAVHRADSSNTLVISRGEGEKETHIAWSQYRRLPIAR
jgi:hypothetical protein